MTADIERRSSLNAWLSFVVTFILLRLLTYGIRYGVLPFHNVVTRSGLHIHHFVWGIFILLIVGFAGYMIEDIRWHPWLAIAFGIGAALVIDEFALWLDLKDVYWAQQGRWSVDLAIVVSGLLGLSYAVARYRSRRPPPATIRGAGAESHARPSSG
jgi:4-amino-4-deoxy-L-arabinose transferase-like glycosyltransferase